MHVLICVDVYKCVCTYVLMHDLTYVCTVYLCIYFRRYECDVGMNAYAYTFVLYILCSEIMTEGKKCGWMTCSRGQYTYFLLRRSRVDISANILIIVVIFCYFYQSLVECSGIVPENKPRPRLCTSSTIYYSLQLGHQKLTQFVPSPFRQANTTHTTPRALHRLH